MHILILSANTGGGHNSTAAALTEQLKEIYDEYEIVVYEGGQNIYDYLIAVE